MRYMILGGLALMEMSEKLGHRFGKLIHSCICVRSSHEDAMKRLRRMQHWLAHRLKWNLCRGDVGGYRCVGCGKFYPYHESQP